MSPLSPTAVLISVVGALGIAAVSASGGWVVRGWKADADTLVKVTNEQVARERVQMRLDAAAEELEKSRQGRDAQLTQTRTTIREIYRDRPIPADCAVPPAGRSLLVNLGANGPEWSASTGGQQGAMPPTTEAPGADAGPGPAGLGGGDSEDVRGLR